MMVDKMEVMKALRKQAVWCVKCSMIKILNMYTEQK